MRKAAAVAFSAAAALSAARALGAPSLKAAAAARGLFLGAAVDAPALADDADYARVLGEQFDMLTPENAMKFDVLHPRPGFAAGSYDFAQADAVVAFARSRGMRVRGHTLVWHRTHPAWAAALSREQQREVLQNHVQTVVAHFRGKIYCWDVVNEAVADDGTLRRRSWAALGPGYIADAFRWARVADPGAKLFYNDYVDGYPHGPMPAKIDGILRLVRRLKQEGVPIDGVGLQMHLAAGLHYGDLRELIRRFARLGVEVHITELDVAVVSAGAAARHLLGQEPFSGELRLQAQMYGEVVGACAAVPACKAVVVWGFTDKHTWLPLFSPTIFDARYAPKPAYEAVRRALADPSS